MWTKKSHIPPANFGIPLQRVLIIFSAKTSSASEFTTSIRSKLEQPGSSSSSTYFPLTPRCLEKKILDQILAMGSLAREEGVLKLVRPGRHLEVHKKPVTAEEVMKRYPQHSITRPDIFEFPWIVVKPEAVLIPGKVFFIVPNRTIYQLLKARKHSDKPPPLIEQKQSVKARGHHQLYEHSSPPKEYTGMTPKQQEQRRRLKLQFFACATVNPSLSDEDADSDRRLQTDIKANKKTRGESKQKPTIHSRNETRRLRKYDDGNNDITVKLADLYIRESTLLKSCIRKPDSARKSLRLKVNFTVPNKEEERQREATGSRVHFQGFSSRLVLQGIY